MVLAFSLIMSAVPAFGAEPTDGMAIVCDVLLARPVSLAAVVVGSALYIVALPFSIPSDSVGKTGQLLVEEPFKYTFFRPLGDFDYRVGTVQMPKTGGAK
jgi:hypothetical protein